MSFVLETPPGSTEWAICLGTAHLEPLAQAEMSRE